MATSINPCTSFIGDVLHSLRCERWLREGRYPLGRFTHTNIQPNTFDAVLQVSHDDGKIWQRVNRNQRLVRRQLRETYSKQRKAYHLLNFPESQPPRTPIIG